MCEDFAELHCGKPLHNAMNHKGIWTSMG